MRNPLEIPVGARIEIEQPKSGTPPASNSYVLDRRDGDAWLMVGGSRVPDSAPCWTDGRVRIVGGSVPAIGGGR